MICYLIFSVLIAAAAFTVRRRSLLRLTGAAFYAVQAAFAVRIVAGGLYGETSAVWFAFDAAGTLFYCLLCIVSAFAFFHSKASLHDCDLRQTRTYAGLLMLLTTAIAGAYFASNLAVTWIFLEATTLCSAGIVYHRRTAQALEAAWKYVFVCSTGIAMAYLGILLLAAATDCESLDYATVAAAAPGGSALYLKTAFLLILCGYSCKAELFPLYTVGVDANFAAPAPASALISTGLVNAGFLALLRVYKLLAATEVFPWVKSVLLLVGVLSLVVGALFLRRTNNYKRFLSYSTVENMGIAAIGLGIGGIGVWAAVFHVVCHTLIKSSLFLQIAVVRQVYGNYRINRHRRLHPHQPRGGRGTAHGDGRAGGLPALAAVPLRADDPQANHRRRPLVARHGHHVAAVPGHLLLLLAPAAPLLPAPAGRTAPLGDRPRTVVVGACRCSPPPSGWGFGSPHFSGN